MLPTQSRGGREEQQQNQIKRQINVTNTTTKAVRNSREGEGREGRGVVSSRGKDIGLAANEVAAAKGDLKTVA